ncbi:MAG: type III toxin-antitoxin system TenpIN family toxin [Faecousia sp.]
MLDLVFLTQDFFSDYSNCREIEKKTNRPHVQVTIEVNGTLFCIPMRSSIKHKHAIFTDKANRCGLDLSKAVVITDPEKYIDSQRIPHIRQNEFKVLKNISKYEVRRRLLAYIAEYKEAKRRPEIARNKALIQCSTLQYFEEYIK